MVNERRLAYAGALKLAEKDQLNATLDLVQQKQFVQRRREQGRLDELGAKRETLTKMEAQLQKMEQEEAAAAAVDIPAESTPAEATEQTSTAV